MDNKGNVENIFDLTDSELSSSSSSNPGIFETHPTYIFEIHDVTQDEPTPENISPDTKLKKLKKKRKEKPALDKSHSSISSGSSSEVNSLARAVEGTKEEFFDAHESYHTMPENKTPNPVTTLAILESQSDHVAGLKIEEQPANVQSNSTTARHTSSTVSVNRQAGYPSRISFNGSVCNNLRNIDDIDGIFLYTRP